MRTTEERLKAIYQKEEAYNHKRKKRKRALRQAVSVMAASIVLLLGIQYGIPDLLDKNDVLVEDKEFGDGRVDDTQQDIDTDLNTSNNKGINIPAIQLPKVKKGKELAMDMIGLIVYQDRIYTQDGYVIGNDDVIGALKGSYLGYAKGNIDEWSSQGEYATEFASTITGEVYQINGYDTDFRIGVITEYDGEKQLHLYSHLNGITLDLGKDLYESRLQLLEKYQSYYYQKHADWDYAQGNYHEFETITEEDMKTFIERLYQSEFVDLYADGNGSVYTEDIKRGHVYFWMKDQTEVALDLIEGGYIRYEHMSGAVFVHMEDEIFDRIFAEATKE